MSIWRNRRIVSIGWHQGSVGSGAGPVQKAGWVVYFPKSAVYLTFTGDAAILVRQMFKGECPRGILLDRLEEYPAEGGKPVSLVKAAVAYYRLHHPSVLI